MIQLLLNNIPHLALEHASRCFPVGFVALAVLYQGKNLPYHFGIYAVVNLASWCLICQYGYFSPFARPTPSGILSLVITIVFFLARSYSLWKSKRLLSDDQKMYDDLWRSLSETEDGKAGVEHLGKVVQMIGIDKKNDWRQTNRMRADRQAAKLEQDKCLSQDAASHTVHPIFSDLCSWTMPNRRDPNMKIASFNQLYCAASIANLLLIERLEEWAESANGMFQVNNGRKEPEFVRWADAKHDLELVSKLKRPVLKRHGRATEKLIRSYANDLSLLLDLARQSLVFESMADLTTCLGIISTDSNVRVERIKNRLDPTYNSDDTAGYRDVCVNLRVVSSLAQALGVEIHMCEVQLLLREYAALRSADGHKRYVQGRNDRGV